MGHQRLTVALVLGSAACLEDNLERYDGPIDGVVACNYAGVVWPCKLDAWATLHPEKLKGWMEERAAKGFPDAKALYCHGLRRARQRDKPEGVIETERHLPGQSESGSSGLFAAKVALIDLGFDRVVFCGVPMTPTPHINCPDNWRGHAHLGPPWEKVLPVWREKMRSMSGWTRELLGAPDEGHH